VEVVFGLLISGITLGIDGTDLVAALRQSDPPPTVSDS
jgi:hypothetical protein